MTSPTGVADAERRSLLPNLASKIFFVAFLVASTVDIVVEWLGPARLARILIFVPMPLLFGYVLSRVRPSTALVRWLLLAIFFSWLGDGFGYPIILKIVFFAGAQLCYLLAFLPYWRASVLRRPVVVVLYAIATAGMIIFLFPYAGSLQLAVIAYAVLVGAMAVLAGGLGRLGVIGGLLFFCSDTILSLQLFVPALAFPGQSALVMLTYLSAQAFLAVAVLDRVTTAVPTR